MAESPSRASWADVRRARGSGHTRACTDLVLNEHLLWRCGVQRRLDVLVVRAPHIGRNGGDGASHALVLA